MKNQEKECINCINTTANPTIIINKKSLCNVCEQYIYSFNKAILKKELKFLKSFLTHNKYDAMVGLSGGKDSTATLYTIKKYGFTPLAFTFDPGYLPKNVFSKSKKIAKELKVDYEIINVKKYISKNEKESFTKMANLYNEKESKYLRKKFRELYKEGRNYYSVKCNISFPFVRPCQICRKIAIKAYYAEAVKRNIPIVVIGINEWTGLSNNHYSAIRKLQPYSDKPPIYIVHLPFLLQRHLSDILPILKEINWKVQDNNKLIGTGADSCLLARACEAKAKRILGFHIDSTRLAREVTVGFITKKQAKEAIKNTKRPNQTVKEVLENAKIL